MLPFLLATLLLTTTTTLANPLAKRNIGGIRLCDQTNWAGNCWYGIVPLNDCIALNSLYVFSPSITNIRSPKTLSRPLISLPKPTMPAAFSVITKALERSHYFSQQRQSPLLPPRRRDGVFFDAVSDPPLTISLTSISLLPSLRFTNTQPRNRCNSQDQYASFESATDFAADLTQFDWIADAESFICMTAK
jgi:hypothetical protein